MARWLRLLPILDMRQAQWWYWSAVTALTGGPFLGPEDFVSEIDSQCTQQA